MRFEDSFELFGVGVGKGTYGDIKCEMCGTLHNEGEDDLGEYNGESVSWTTFAGMCVCECCFERVENEILRRMPDILPWYRRILDRQKASIANLDSDLKSVEANS